MRRCANCGEMFDEQEHECDKYCKKCTNCCKYVSDVMIGA